MKNIKTLFLVTFLTGIPIMGMCEGHWWNLSSETKNDLASAASDLGDSAIHGASKVLKWGKSLFEESDDSKLEREIIKDLNIKSLQYYNNYDNSGKPALVVMFKTFKNINKLKINFYGEHFKELNIDETFELKKGCPVVDYLDYKLGCFPDKVKIEVIGSLTSEKRDFEFTITDISN